MSLIPITKTILKSLFQKYSTLAYPFKPMPKDPLVRGQISIEINKCTFCGMCSRKCPTHAIEVTRNDRSWEISRFHCIQCNECASVCPAKCLRMINELTPSSGEKTRYKAIADNAGAVKPAAASAGSAPEEAASGAAAGA